MVNKYKPLVGRKLRVVLYDMDGTLYDSMPSHAHAWMSMCAEHGIEACAEDFFLWEGRTGRDTIGDLIRRTFNRKATADECESLYKRKTELFSAMPKVPVMPGAQKLVNELISREFESVLVTGSGQASLLTRLEADFPGVFPRGRCITSHDVTHGKPHPEPYLRGMALCNARPEECVVIENAPLGVKAGVASGALTVGVLTGPIPRDEMEQAGAHLIFDSMMQCAEQLPTILMDYNKKVDENSK